MCMCLSILPANVRAAMLLPSARALSLSPVIDQGQQHGLTVCDPRRPAPIGVILASQHTGAWFREAREPAAWRLAAAAAIGALSPLANSLGLSGTISSRPRECAPNGSRMVATRHSLLAARPANGRRIDNLCLRRRFDVVIVLLAAERSPRRVGRWRSPKWRAHLDAIRPRPLATLIEFASAQLKPEKCELSRPFASARLARLQADDSTR